ncbi:MAG: hypothetical protein K2X50_06900 [Gammaproteobacteria bacterium]|nr:hypothetical protein [Gammaproteobacteria bacterium]
MQKKDEQILQQSELSQFTYKKIVKAQGQSSIPFKHDDQSINKALRFDSGGYVSFSIIPIDKSESSKPSAQDRRAMFQNRAKPPPREQDRPQWTVTPAQQNKETPMMKEAGWKFHLSIAQNSENVEKAWDVLLPLLIKHKVGQAKVVKPEHPSEASKVIAVYTFNGGPKLDQWEPFLKDVESAFKDCKIDPGEKIFEHKIEGSEYIYYRNDAGFDGKYVADEYKFMYRVVDKIPIPGSEMTKLDAELKENQNMVGCIVKLRDSDTCCLYVKDNDNWHVQKFDVGQLRNLENPNQPHPITISPINNRPAYLELVVPRLNKTIPDTNNVTKEPNPFKTVDFTQTRSLATVNFSK